jgi:polar amino acid transport system substrate-binding protein
MSRLLGLAMFMFLVCFHVPAHSAQLPPLRYVTEESPPDNFTENGVLKGISVELLHEIWKVMGVSKQPIEVLPWTQAYRKTLETPNTVLFTIVRNAEREALFKWAGPITIDKAVLIAERKTGVRLTSPRQLNNYKIGTVVDDINETVLVNLGVPLANLDRAASSTQNFEKFKHGRFDLLPFTENGIHTALKLNGMNPDNYRVVFTLSENRLYYAFHKSTPDAVVQKYQQALDTLRKNGTLKKIQKKYGVIPLAAASMHK